MKTNDQYRLERLDRGIRVRTEGIYAISDWKEILYILLPRLLLIVGMLSILLLMPSFYWRRVVSVTCIYMMLAIGFDFLSNYVGLVSLGGAFFIGVGGYISAVLNSYFGIPTLISIPIATLGGGFLCTVLLIPCLPLRGVYFAIATLMYPLIATRMIEALNVFGGTDGLVDVSGFTNKWFSQYLIVVVALICLFGLRRLVSEDFGLIMRGIKDNDQAVKASAVNITFVKAVAVFIASSMGCFSGAYLVHIYMWAGLSMFGLDFSIIPIAATVVGGPGTLIGPVIGSLILVPLSELLRTFGTLRIAFYSFVLLIFIIWKSEGIMVYAERKYHQFQHMVKV